MKINLQRTPQIICVISLATAVPLLVFGRAVLAAMLAIGFLALISSNLFGPSLRHISQQLKRPLGLIILATIFVWSISALGSSFPLRSLEAVLRSGLFIIFATMVYVVLISNTELRVLFSKTFILTSTLCAAFAILSLKISPEIYWFAKLKGWQSVDIKKDLKGFSSLGALIIPALCLSSYQMNRIWPTLAAFACIAMVILIWETHNRAALAGLLGMIFVCVGVWYFGRPKLRTVLLVSTGVVAAHILVIFLLWKNFRYVIDKAPAGDWFFPVWLIDFQRQTIWAETLNISGKMPWFGVGANTVNFVPGAEKPLPGEINLHIVPAHPHNWLVEIIAETGAIGAVLLIATIAMFFYILLQIYRETPSAGILASSAVSGGYWVSGLFNFSYWSAWWQIAFLLLSAYCLSFSCATNYKKKSFNNT